MLHHILSTRLFPRNCGADAYAITGLAARCDWVVLSDYKTPQVLLSRNRNTDAPAHIFLSLRAASPALQFFVREVLPLIHSSFVLITGSADITLPRQIDQRWRPFNADERAMLDEILNHPHLLHWYAENLDEGGSPHRSPLPLGLVFPDGLPDSPLPDAPGLAQRDLKVFCAHRHRDGAQWQLRRDLSKLAQGQWREFCTVPEGEISEAAFVAEIHRHTFVLCAEGGGLDPSPKAWLALLHGAIPIIRRTPLEAAYAHLPVVMVEAWDAESLSVEKLAAWRNELLPWFDDMERRREVLRRLTTDYWWNIISATIPIAATAAIACKSDQ